MIEFDTEDDPPATLSTIYFQVDDMPPFRIVVCPVLQCVVDLVDCTDYEYEVVALDGGTVH